jgi:hypothetical protein
MVIKAVGSSTRTYDSAHKRVTFGRGWMVKLPDGTKGMMIWRPDPDRPDEKYA